MGQFDLWRGTWPILRRSLARIRGLFHRARRDRDMEEEFASHLAMETDEYRRRGLSAEQARRRALIGAGGLDRAREAYRDQRGLPRVDATAAELRGAMARLHRHPGTLAGTALSLAIGMALATAMFGMVNALFLHPLPFPHPDQLVRVRVRNPKLNALFELIPARDALAAEMATSISGVATAQLRGPGVNLGPSGAAVRVDAVPVTSNYFRLLGARPLLGRTFTDADGGDAAPPVILSYSLWRGYFGARRDIVGTAVPLDGGLSRVIGVMPDGFSMPLGADAWLLLDHHELARLAAPPADRIWQNNETIARLKPGVSLARAQADLSLAFHRAGSVALLGVTPTADVIPLARDVTAPYRDQLRLWVAAAFVILLLCAVNFATMALARGMRRREELAVRLALGASRRRVAWMLLAEAMLIGAVGGACAALFAHWLLDARRLWFGAVPLPVPPVMNWHTVAFGVVGTVVVGLLFALPPALELSRTDLRPVLSGGVWSTGGSREIRNRRGLVALQLGLSLACMAVLAALVAAERNSQGVGPGYDYSHIVSANLYVPDTAASRDFAGSLVQAVEAVPGVRSAAIVRRPAFPAAASLYPDWRPKEAAGIDWKDVSPGYFATLGLPPLAGRLPTEDEVEARAPVMVLSKSTARWLFGQAAPIGRRVGLPLYGGTRPSTWFTVIGVVPDVRDAPRYEANTAPVYTVQALPLGHTTTELRIRMAGDPRLTLHTVRDAIGRIDPRIVVSDVQPVADQVTRWSGQARSRTVFFSLVAAMALVLAIIGVYGLTSYSVALRAREYGIRMALGAGRARLVRSVLADFGGVAIGAVAGGLLLGGRAVFLVDHYLRNPMLPRPALTMQLLPVAVSAVTLLVVMVAGTAIPVRRVLRQDIVRAIQGGT